jgi:hypothetical protein
VADRIIKLRNLRSIATRFGIQEDTSLGKGSHTVFFQRTPTGVISYPVPTTRPDVLICYVKGFRRRFHLREQAGVSDKEFYGK